MDAHGEGFERASERAGAEGREGKGGRSERDEGERRVRRGTEASEYVCRCELVYTVYVPAAVSLRECRLELRWGRRGEGRGQKVQPEFLPPSPAGTHPRLDAPTPYEMSTLSGLQPKITPLHFSSSSNTLPLQHF